jgi:hypothetical protein
LSDAPPFFILGAQGSGSTLLRLMLDSHERLAVPQETGVLRLVTAHRWVPFWTFGDRWHTRLGLSGDDVDRALEDLYGGMFRRYAESRGKVRWGEKTPFHVWHVDDIRRVFPTAVLVAIVRHPLGSVGSTVRRFDRAPARAVEQWLATTRELVHQAGRVGDRLCLLRYEDLTLDPRATMTELLDWLGEPWSESVLHHDEVQRRERSPRSVEGGTRPGDAVDAARIDRWRDWFDDAEHTLVVERTARWAELLGYGATPAEPLARLTDPAADRLLVATGTELAGRRSAFPDLDFSAPLRPTVDDPILPRGRRRREQALRRAQSAPEEAARQLFERMPPRLQRRVRDARRRRRDGG